jgi:hypothetical protein
VEFLLSSKAFNPKDFSYRINLSSKQKDTTFNLHEKVHENIRNVDTSLAMCLEKWIKYLMFKNYRIFSSYSHIFVTYALYF